ncbi:methyl-accepting chemotaxis protein [Brunnivagina elsteri]|uniref:Chemotaxis protein n=1 Tax=Brunnivagina elsteri CCALA 953 TaxID=987040 RepID=A0A2A2TK32_9CYAN|nr:methyl-accepting chemotaxis protein [Calothrix elsteri]PAX56560.1 chemotaxis protein [Calothrix elsteri CCALA 953]
MLNRVRDNNKNKPLHQKQNHDLKVLGRERNASTKSISEPINYDLETRGAFPLLGNINLRTKAIAFAVAISTLPIFAIAAITYLSINQSLNQEIATSHNNQANKITINLKLFIRERLQDLDFLASQDFLTNIRVRDHLSYLEKQQILQKYEKYNKFHSQIVILNLSGNVVFQSKDGTIPNQSQESYFESVLKTNQHVISQLSNTQTYFSAPVRDTVTGEIIYVIRSTVETQLFDKFLKQNRLIPDKYYVTDVSNKIFLSNDKNIVGKNVQELFAKEQLNLKNQLKNQSITNLSSSDYRGKDALFSYIPWQRETDIPDLKWNFLLITDKAILFAPQRQLLWELGLGTLATSIFAGGIAALLARRNIDKIIAVNQALKKLAQGNSQNPISLTEKDGIQSLNANINQMAEHLQDTQALKNLAIHLSSSWKPNEIYNLAVQDIRKALKVERVVIYKFDENWQGTFLAESVVAGFPCAMNVNLHDPCLVDYADKYRQGKVLAVNNIYQANLSDCYLQQLETFAVKANLVVPIIVGDKLLGLLIAHQCSQPRNWQQSETDLFEQFARLLGLALERANLLVVTENARETAENLFDEQRQQKEELQAQLMTLLEQVEGAIQGDLTVHAEVGVGEIGTVADFFNAIAENLRSLVKQVKTSAAQLNNAVAENSSSMQQLADASRIQAEEISYTLNTVGAMRNAIKTVAKSARRAAKMAHNASQTAITGSAAMDATVENIAILHDTIDETTCKVRSLGEASQQIGRVVNLINQISMQTNLLAINAGIEAARAGEGRQGFVSIAEEVAILASKSAVAAGEIEAIASSIQRETSEVVSAMESGSVQVNEGTRLVAATKDNLSEILDACRQIDDSLDEISNTTVSQVQLSQKVTTAIKNVAHISNMTSDYSQKFVRSLWDTVVVSEQLKASVEIFKVEE